MNEKCPWSYIVGLCLVVHLVAMSLPDLDAVYHQVEGIVLWAEQRHIYRAAETAL